LHVVYRHSVLGQRIPRIQNSLELGLEGRTFLYPGIHQGMPEVERGHGTHRPKEGIQVGVFVEDSGVCGHVADLLPNLGDEVEH
jgi:hypothetical protein